MMVLVQSSFHTTWAIPFEMELELNLLDWNVNELEHEHELELEDIKGAIDGIVCVKPIGLESARTLKKN